MYGEGAKGQDSQYKLASSLDIRPYYIPVVTKRLACTRREKYTNGTENKV